MCGFRLRTHQRIAFGMIGAALGMTDNDVGAETIGDHFGGNVAGVGARLLLMAILRADQQRAIVAKRRRHVEQGRRRADQRFDLGGEFALDPFGHRLDLIERGAGSVHLPVAGDERADIGRHAVSSGCFSPEAA
ncbi:hypothetical protein D9M72_473340 [compost metagenome]